MKKVYTQLQETVTHLGKRLGKKQRKPQVGIVLGSGLGEFAKRLKDPESFRYQDIPHFPESTAPGHAGTLWFGKVGSVRVVVMQGRHHYYEGNTPEQCVYGLRTMISMGAGTIILTNAAGTIDDQVSPGDLRIISDHINMTGETPLRGHNDTRLGQRFVPMNGAYDVDLRAHALSTWSEDQNGTKSIKLHPDGVYALMPGPEYETPAEINRLKNAGANLVGMSTVFETIAARHMSAQVFAMSCVTNYAAGVKGSVPNEQEVLDTAQQSSKEFVNFMTNFIATMPLP
ncbi:MAG: purine-nucleoside phosphorylase [Candidatus Magasanikbacteria bacterium]|nr:purine-nucleoside phosphorylase [Candidatus Magasanikbacteria bacterium]